MTDKPLLDFAKKLMSYDGQDTRATNALEFFHQAPARIHPEDPWRQILMRGVQEGLLKIGYKVPRSGYADKTTAQALVTAVSPRWRLMTWRDIYASLQECRR